MTLEQLLECDADKLEAMSVQELEKFFEPMLDITRPERDSAIYKESNSGRKEKLSKVDLLKAKLFEKGQDKVMGLFKDLDIEFEDLL